MKIHISFYVNYCKVLAFCFVKEVHNVLRLLGFYLLQTILALILLLFFYI